MTAEVEGSHAEGTVTGQDQVGGLVGYIISEIANSYATGRVSGREHVGGVVGSGSHDVLGCFWDTQTSGLSDSAGGEGKTTAEMKQANTFVGAGWDFAGETANGTEDIWWIAEGRDYPRFSWEHQALTIPGKKR